MRSLRSHGITLVELLVAVAVFSVVVLIAFSGIVGGLRVHVDQEAATAAQGKLRRVVEVVSQDIRSAVFGSVVSVPYAPDAESVSIMLLSGGTGFSVIASDPGSFATSNQVTVIAENGDDLAGSQVAVVNGNGEGVLFDVSSVSGGSSDEWVLQHACQNRIAFTPNNMLLFEVETLGLRYDEDSGTIWQRQGAGNEIPFAFDVSDFRIDYIYTSQTASDPFDRRSAPALDGGVPTREYIDAGDRFRLARLQVVVSASEASRGDTIDRTYSGQIDLSSNESFFVKEVQPACGTP